jgi:hypothetical protein
VSKQVASRCDLLRAIVVAGEAFSTAAALGRCEQRGGLRTQDIRLDGGVEATHLPEAGESIGGSGGVDELARRADGAVLGDMRLK